MQLLNRRDVRLGMVFVAGMLCAGYFLREPLSDMYLYGGISAGGKISRIRGELTRQQIDLVGLRRSSDSDHELKAAEERFTEWQNDARKRCIQLAAEHPGTRTEAAALLMVADCWPESDEAGSARESLLRLASTTDIGEWASAIDDAAVSNKDVERWRPVVRQLIHRVSLQPDHPEAARLLCKAGNLVAPDPHAESAPEEFVAVADLIREQYPASPDIANFCEQVGGWEHAPVWGSPFEDSIRRILEMNEDRFVRCSAKFALASIVRSGGMDRRAEAQQLFEEFLVEFDGETQYPARGIEQKYRETAKQVLSRVGNQRG